MKITLSRDEEYMLQELKSIFLETQNPVSEKGMIEEPFADVGRKEVWGVFDEENDLRTPPTVEYEIGEISCKKISEVLKTVVCNVKTITYSVPFVGKAITRIMAILSRNWDFVSKPPFKIKDIGTLGMEVGDAQLMSDHKISEAFNIFQIITEENVCLKIVVDTQQIHIFFDGLRVQRHVFKPLDRPIEKCHTIEGTIDELVKAGIVEYNFAPRNNK